MKRSAFALLMFVAACGPRPVTTGPGPNMPGAAGPREAVESFLGAVKAQDLQAMSIIWGTEKGPARDQIPRDDLEKRELIIQCHLSHDAARILSDAPGQDRRRVYAVELTKGNIVRSTNFYVIPGPAARWYVESVDLEPVIDLCRLRSGDE